MCVLFYKTYHNNKKDWVVCLHAVCTGHFIFDGQLDELSKYFNVLLIDLPGHYQSKDQPMNMKEPFDHTIREVTKVLDHVGVKKAYFVGVSLGTIVIHQLILQEPWRVKKAVLGGAAIAFTPEAMRFLRIAKRWIYFLPYKWYMRKLMIYMMPKENHQPANNIIMDKGALLGRKNFIYWLHAISRIEQIYDERINATNVPRLYISGEEDHTLLPSLMEKIEESQTTSVHIMKRCGHMVNMERPDEFNQHMIAFFNSASA
nr:alpha/beta hydrolase [Pontibacillus yanchengensis]